MSLAAECNLLYGLARGSGGLSAGEPLIAVDLVEIAFRGIAAEQPAFLFMVGHRLKRKVRVFENASGRSWDESFV